MTRPQLCLLVALLLGLSTAAHGHAFTPAVLVVRELGPSHAEIVWTAVPPKPGAQRTTEPVIDAACNELRPRSRQQLGDDRVSIHWAVDCGPGGLVGKQIAARELGTTETEVLVRLELVSGETHHRILRRDAPSFIVPANETMGAVVASYLKLGVEHILGGYDHLLFVLGLFLLVSSSRRLIATITSFTLAHSVTLSLAALGWVHVPQAATEAVIALSIVLLAVELLQQQRRADPSLAMRFPWMVAFGFGLLHGFGFAGALTEVGLPDDALAPALFGFNCGVELGQLAFVTTLALGVGLARTMARSASGMAAQLRHITAYALGSVATYWCVERLVLL